MFVLGQIKSGSLQGLLHVLLRPRVPAVSAHRRRVPVSAAPAPDTSDAVTAPSPIPPSSVVGPIRGSGTRPDGSLIRRLVRGRALRRQRVSERRSRLVERRPDGVDVVLQVVALHAQRFVARRSHELGSKIFLAGTIKIGN